MGKTEIQDDDNFNVITEITNIKTDEEEKAYLAAKAEKKRLKALSKEEREAQRKANRENREKKKLKKDINKKKKKGELVIEDVEVKEPVLDAEGNVVEPVKREKAEKKKKEIEYGIWVGNLAYSTTLDSIKNFFKDCGTITRIKCPKGNGVKNHNKGFAYIFFSSAEEAAKGVALSETTLDDRKLLIKDSENFERADGSTAPTEKEKREIKKQKNPPCPTLFLGNLSFDTKEETIRAQFEWAGDIRKVRVATFEDSGKCKGFAYIDYFLVESATKAIRAPDKHTLDGRKVRVEFASEEAHMRSKPWLMREKQKGNKRPAAASDDASNDNTEEPTAKRSRDNEGFAQRRHREGGEEGEEKRVFRERKPKKEVRNDRMKPGEVLSSAQRQKPTVQEFKGTKITF